MRAIEVTATGPLTCVQDLGRAGWAHLGVPRSGAADLGALRLANRLLGNPEGAAGLEVLLGGFAATALADLLVTVTGAAVPVLVDGVEHPPGAVLTWRSGTTLRLGTATAGLRAYLAVHGGWDVPPVLGSRSTDLLSGLGPEPVRPGDVLPAGPVGTAAGWPILDAVALAAPPTGLVTLEALPGPRDDLLADGERLPGHVWRVSGRSDRVGLRLEGAPVRTRAGAHVPSEPLVRGAVQLPPGGEPVVFLADHPVTGGYPVVAVLTEASCDRAAQLRPGQPVRLSLLPRLP
ncbi:biotin-dependent carboxyltransferase family protein [Spongisporangium articulatum]|uniref:Biotin-dependent carboxyltransferase family protein n=1 Tax=Spongisporangium articulatum TaxID=3362603 RepID=A0ABW8AK42_9ACTN